MCVRGPVGVAIGRFWRGRHLTGYQVLSCLENLEGCLEDGKPAKAVLEQSGYREWLDASDQDERLRVLGALHLIADVSEDLAED